MKQSNLALRQDAGPDTPEPVPVEAPAREPAPAQRRLAYTRSLGLEYRAIVIHDDGLRPFRVR